MHDWRIKTLMRWCFVTVLSFLQLVCGEVCTVARQKCQNRYGCSIALRNYMIRCGPLIHGETNQCSSSCQKALISLLSTQDQQGLNFMACDCNNEAYCITQRRRIDVCSKDVLPIMEHVKDKSKPIPCSLAELICVVDTSCNRALEFYTDYCRRMWRGDKCTLRCNNSLSILYRQEKAQKLKNCICDRSEGYDQAQCQVIHDNTQRLCFKSRRPRDRTKDPAYNVTHYGSGTKSHNKTLKKPDYLTTVTCASNKHSYHQSGAISILALLLWILSVL